MTMYNLHPGYRPKTLCEVCADACGFCSWSEKGNMRPVPGWDAIRKDFPSGDKYKDPVESYIVLHCPLFELEKHNHWAFERFDPEQIRAKYDDCNAGSVAPRQGVRKKVRCIDTGIVYPSVKEASAKTGSTEYTIRAACTGLTRKTRKGARWEYITEESEEVHHD